MHEGTSLSLVYDIQVNLQELNKDPLSESLLVSYIDLLLDEKTNADIGAVKQLAEIDDPLTKALSCYLDWHLISKDNFEKIKNFFSFLSTAMEKYSTKTDLNSKLFQIFVEKRIQFKLYEELENDLIVYKDYLEKVPNYNLVFLQERILTSFFSAFVVLVKNGKLDKAKPTGPKMYEICLALEKKYATEERFDLERIFIELRIRINSILKVELEKTAHIRIAESYVDEGNTNEKKGLGFGLHSYATAFMTFLDIGEKDRLGELRSKLKTAAAALNSSLKPIQIGSFKVSIKEWSQVVIPLIQYYDVLKSTVTLNFLYPRFKKLSDNEIGITAQIMGTIVIDNYDNVSAIMDWSKDQEEIRKFKSFQVFQIEEAKQAILRLQIFKYLTEVQLLSEADIQGLISSSQIDNELKERLKVGVGKYFLNDFMSSAYFLTLQLEPLLVSLARNKAGIIAISHKQNRRGATQETTLGTLLDNEKIRNLFDADFYQLLLLYFVYDLGLNYRNVIAHGLVDHKKLTQEYSSTLIFVICRILFLLK